MSDLIAFIEARLAEDELVARRTGGASWQYTEFSDFDGGQNCALHFGERTTVDVGFMEDDALRPSEAEHAARHDPARVLREVEAKRRIVDECRSTMEWADRLNAEGLPGNSYAHHAGALLGALRNLATVWSDHPDYRTDWVPENVGGSE